MLILSEFEHRRISFYFMQVNSNFFNVFQTFYEYIYSTFKSEIYIVGLTDDFSNFIPLKVSTLMC